MPTTITNHESVLVLPNSTIGTMLAASSRSFTFGLVDYIVFIIMLLTSASIGVYFGFFSKSKNTTDEYLMGSKKMKMLPIAISLVASQLSGVAIMSVPSENYTYGFCYIFMVVAILVVIPTLCYIVVPVFYENNISNCYEYLQMRFNKTTRQLVTATFILNSFMMLPVIIFIPALAFSQVTSINIHLINAVVCSICVFYTMLGGIKAVVWTDVVQAGIMVSSVVLVGVLGTINVGGLGKVIERAAAGGRLEFSLSLDPRVRTTVWNAFIGGGFMWLGHIGLNQSCVQRIVSLPSLSHAKKSLQIAGLGIIVIMSFTSFIGIVMYARYFNCDPVAAGVVDKYDKMVPFFVQDVVGRLKGMPGVFISCVFSAALSTMSAILNSLAGVVYFDYIKPFIKHTDERANAIMRVFVIVMGFYCIAGGLVVQQFSSILQMIITITGINTGAVAGVFLLGMFVPRVNGKVAAISIACSVIGMIWIIVNGQMRFKAGLIRYSPLSTTTAGCEAEGIQVLTIPKSSIAMNHTFNDIETPRITTAFGSNRDFSIYEISFYWYKLLGVILVWLVGIPLSYIWTEEEDEKLNPKLYTPLVRRFIPKREMIELEGLPLKTPITDTEGSVVNGKSATQN